MAIDESDADPSKGTPSDPLVQRYLDHVRFEKRLAVRTVALYTLDLEKLVTHAAQLGVALTAVEASHIRRWVAQMHSGGRSGRGIALILSGWRGFLYLAWARRAGGGQPGAGCACAQGCQSPCPRP